MIVLIAIDGVCALHKSRDDCAATIHNGLGTIAAQVFVELAGGTLAKLP